MATLLSNKTKHLLNAKQYDLVIICNHTGLNYDWLVKFKGDRIKDPSVNKVQKLYEYLSGKPLFAE